MSTLYPKYLHRYKDLALLLFKHKQRDLAHRIGLDRLFESPEDAEKSAEEKDAVSLVSDLERLGPAFVKLGQLLSTRSDMLPEEYMEALSRLQDQVTPLSYGTVREMIMEELDANVSDIFEYVEEQPLAAASIGQVHRARLLTGEDVVVKVQRPGIREEITADLEVLGRLAHFLDTHTEIGHRYRFLQMFNALRRVLIKEIDYEVEAQNAIRFAHNLKRFRMIFIPRPYLHLTTDRVLVLEYIQGVKLTDMKEEQLNWLDRPMLARELFRCYLHQTLIDGFFHADPHPGNIFIIKDGRLAFIDFGMVVNVPQSVQQGMVKLVLALNDAEGDEVADVAVAMGRQEEGFDLAEFRERERTLVVEHSSTAVAKLKTGKILLDLQSIAGATNLRLPVEMMMLGKTLLNLDKLVTILDPSFLPRKEMRRYSTHVFLRRSRSKLTLDRALKAALETGELAQALPSRLNKITAMLADNEMSFRVDAINEKKLIAGIQKIANRVTTGLVLAALIIGASLMMQMESTFTVFGYPVIAFIFYILASIGGVALIVRSLLKDENEGK